MAIARILSEPEQRVWAVYRALWASLEADGVRVYYATEDVGGMFTPPEARDDGSIRRPSIEVDRWYGYPSDEPSPTRGPGWTPGAPLAPDHPDLTAELIILAHEAGHHASWKAGNWTRALLEATKATKPSTGRVRQEEHKKLREREPRSTRLPSRGRRYSPKPHVTRQQKRLIVAEELRAWDIARSMLARLGFDEWHAFEVRRETSVGSYRRMPLRRHTR